MLVPVGIAYALASGVPGIYGLYATIVPSHARSLVSRSWCSGPDSSLAPVILAVVFPLSGGDAMRAVALASMMAVVSGLVCVLIGILRLGFVWRVVKADFATAMNGIAKIPDQPAAEALWVLYRCRWSIARPRADHRRHSRRTGEDWTSFAVGAGTLAAILLLKPYKRIPGLLLAVVAATIVVGILNLDATAGVKVLGPLPPRDWHHLACR